MQPSRFFLFPDSLIRAILLSICLTLAACNDSSSNTSGDGETDPANTAQLGACAELAAPDDAAELAECLAEETDDPGTTTGTGTSDTDNTATLPADPSGDFATLPQTARFLTQATFGPTPTQLDTLTGVSASAWYRAELEKPATLVEPFLKDWENRLQVAAIYGGTFTPPGSDDNGSGMTDSADQGADDEPEGTGDQGATEQEQEQEEAAAAEAAFDDFRDYVNHLNQAGFWNNALRGDDQLRQRVAFVLSQILVVSDAAGEALNDFPGAMAYYQDVLTRNALGNYRQLLEEVTYAPAMGYWLTYMGNQKGDPATGRIPDENYAREILQLFSIGLVQLNPDGSAKTDANGQPLETYNNDDIAGLARVFTGLDLDLDGGYSLEAVDLQTYGQTADLWLRPMRRFPNRHSALEKHFLGSVIPANTDAASSISMALDTIFNHPNVGPFIGRQLIQRLVTSAPEPAYIARVSAAFDSGSYSLPDGGMVGNGVRGDLAATMAAVLFDTEARTEPAMQGTQFGKLREPILRLTAWARAFGAEGIQAEHVRIMENLEDPAELAQQGYKAPSVFNFYRPGYVAPGTLTGAANLTMPEFQLVNTATVPSSINTLNIFATNQHVDRQQLTDLANDFSTNLGITLDVNAIAAAALADYSALETVAVSDTNALLDRVGQLLTYGYLSTNSRAEIKAIIDALPTTANAQERSQLAVMLVMSSPDFLIQQ